MEMFDTALHDVKIVVPARIGDARGFFSEVWNATRLSLQSGSTPFCPGQSRPQSARRERCAACITRLPRRRKASWCG